MSMAIIANQCPFQGGKAVYKARIFISEFNDNIEYDDDNICLQAGYYRQQELVLPEIKSLNFSIIPNPANDKAEIVMSQSCDGICILYIEDMTGRMVYKINFKGSEKGIILPTATLSTGVYHVKLSCNNQYSEIHKLSIVR